MGAVFALDEIAFIAAKPTRPSDDWSSWLRDHAHSHGGALWRLLDPAPLGRPGAGHSHVVHLPGDRVHEFDRGTKVSREAGDAAVHAETRRDTWTRDDDGISLDNDSAVTGMIVAQVLCADPCRVDEWDTWYEQQHLPDMMASGAFVTGSRWHRSDPRHGEANHLTIYEIAGRRVDEAIEMSAAAMPPLIAAGRKHECHAGALTWALEVER